MVATKIKRLHTLSINVHVRGCSYETLCYDMKISRSMVDVFKRSLGCLSYYAMFGYEHFERFYTCPG